MLPKLIMLLALANAELTTYDNLAPDFQTLEEQRIAAEKEHILSNKIFANMYHSEDTNNHRQNQDRFFEDQNHIPVEDEVVALQSYLAAILLFDQFVSTAALVNERWVITSAENLFVNKNVIADLSARFGSTDYTRGGILLSISNVEIHPYYQFSTPGYDVAMLRLNHMVMMSPSMKPLRLPARGDQLQQPKSPVGSWSKKPTVLLHNHKHRFETKEDTNKYLIHLLHFYNLQMIEPEDCINYLNNITHHIGETPSVSCFCAQKMDFEDPCMRDGGAPIVSDGVLWGVTSSFIPEDCKTEDSPILVTMTTEPDVQIWMNTLLKTQSWRRRVQINYFTSNDDDLGIVPQSHRFLK